MFQVNPLQGMKNQALFSSKDKSKKLKCHLLQFLFGPLRVRTSRFRGSDKFSVEQYTWGIIVLKIVIWEANHQFSV